MKTKKIVNLNNKSRRGRYLYLKEEGKRGKYFKIEQGDEIAPIEQYYKDTIKGRPKGTLKQYKRKPFLF